MQLIDISLFANALIYFSGIRLQSRYIKGLTSALFYIKSSSYDRHKYTKPSRFKIYSFFITDSTFLWNEIAIQLSARNG